MAKHGLVTQPMMSEQLLQIAGTDIRQIDFYFDRVVMWLRLILVDRPTAVSDEWRPRALQLVDELAIFGHSDALELQRDLEI
jgi:hypothetical protein